MISYQEATYLILPQATRSLKILSEPVKCSLWRQRSYSAFSVSVSSHFTYPLVQVTVGTPRMIGLSFFSTLLCFQPFEGLHPTLINLSILLCCLPISFSVCSISMWQHFKMSDDKIHCRNQSLKRSKCNCL